MKCPKCGKEMLECPILGGRRPPMKYWLCFNCVHRILIRCKYASDLEGFGMWCFKENKPCNLSSLPDGYVFCPLIREMQEQSASWVKAQNRESEEKLKNG